MSCKRKILWIILSLCAFQTFLGLWNQTNVKGQILAQYENDYYKMRVEVRVYDIDQKTSYSSIEILIRLGPLPHQFNETGVWVQILGGGYIMLFCNYTGRDTYGKYFQGNSSSLWYYIGEGELFPFDSYHMEFRLRPFIDANFTINEAFPIFLGPKQKFLWDTWETGNSYNAIPYQVPKNTEPTLTVILKRKCFIPFLAFVLPVILCYYFLGASQFLDSKSKMQEILTLYVSLFVFVPTFFILIQDFVPYRSLLTIPELLLTFLITSIGFLGISAMTHDYLEEIKICNKKLPPSEWFGLIASLAIFAFYYWLLFFQTSLRSGSIEAMVTFLIIIGSYLFGIIGFLHRLKKENTKNSKQNGFLLVCYE